MLRIGSGAPSEQPGGLHLLTSLIFVRSFPIVGRMKRTPLRAKGTPPLLIGEGWGEVNEANHPVQFGLSTRRFRHPMTIKAKLNTFDATMIVVSLVIGIGMFHTPASDSHGRDRPRPRLSNLPRHEASDEQTCLTLGGGFRNIPARISHRTYWALKPNRGSRIHWLSAMCPREVR